MFHGISLRAISTPNKATKGSPLTLCLPCQYTPVISPSSWPPGLGCLTIFNIFEQFNHYRRLDRLARDLSVQMNLIVSLKRHNITLFSISTGQDVTGDMESNPMLKAFVQIQVTFAEQVFIGTERQ